NSINNVYKGYGYIREAIELLTNKEEYAAIIVGGEEVSLPIKTYCFGYVKNDDIMSDLYNMADLFLLPSVADNYPYTPMEAMACGTPVLVSDAASLPEVTGDSAVIVRAEDTDSITQGLVRLDTDADLRRRLSLEGLARAKTFTWERSAGMLYDIYREVLG
ncbi:MAG: glycosyltransferase, partial [Oscillospiraceae bacterium]|nr:glycosyltransferase [Oscillospiraceae bacterium]